MPPDPGAGAESMHGQAWECVFTWDTAMRLRRRARDRGAEVLLTLRDPQGDYRPRDWRPDRFPGLDSFGFKTLVEDPAPASVGQALRARVDTANRLYRERQGRRDVYFVSLHFDSTAPHLAGISFYYPPWTGKGTGFVQALAEEIRRAGRERRSLLSGREQGLVAAHDFAVLSHSENPDSYLVELGNIRSADGSDLWRMRAPETREEYAGLVVRALESYVRDPGAWAGRQSLPRQRPGFRRLTVLAASAGALAALLAGVLLLIRRRNRPGLPHSGRAAVDRPPAPC